MPGLLCVADSDGGYVGQNQPQAHLAVQTVTFHQPIEAHRPFQEWQPRQQENLQQEQVSTKQAREAAHADQERAGAVYTGYAAIFEPQRGEDGGGAIEHEPQAPGHGILEVTAGAAVRPRCMSFTSAGHPCHRLDGLRAAAQSRHSLQRSSDAGGKVALHLSAFPSMCEVATVSVSLRTYNCHGVHALRIRGAG